jgi:hypothetical protein
MHTGFHWRAVHSVSICEHALASLQADSLEEVQAQLVARGIPFVRQVVVEDGIEVSQVFFHDVDNNMIEVGADH